MTKIILNKDKDFVEKIITKIKANNGYCPCSLLKNEDTICPCKTFRDTKECHCGLYVKEY